LPHVRGNGESGAATYTDAGTEDRLGALKDIQAALAWLRQRSEARPGDIGLVGASLGANLAAIAAADDPDVRALVLLSPTLDFRGVRSDAALRKYGSRPALLVASLEDGYAVRSTRELATSGTGLREVRLLEGAGHGTVMLARQPDLAAGLVDWLCSRLL
jgi:acetyl esterase/lipase